MTSTNTTIVSRSEATALARKLFFEKMPKEEIASKLSEAGYVSKKTGKALTPQGAEWLARYGKIRRHTKRRNPRRTVAASESGETKTVTSAIRKNDRLELIRRILETASLSAEDRIALALLSL